MRNKPEYRSKYINHRLYGFLNGLFTEETFKMAIMSNAPFEEIDVRFSVDAIGFVYHDSNTRKQQIFFN